MPKKSIKKGGLIAAVAPALIEKASNQVDDLIGTIFGAGIKKKRVKKSAGKIKKTIEHKPRKNYKSKQGSAIVQSGPLP